MTTSQTSPRFAYTVMFAIAMFGMLAVAGAGGAGNGQPTAVGINVSAMMTGPAVANLPDLTVEQPF